MISKECTAHGKWDLEFVDASWALSLVHRACATRRPFNPFLKHQGLQESGILL